MTKNFNHRASKLTAALFGAALLTGCAHHAAPMTTDATITPDSSVAATAAPATQEVIVTPTTAPTEAPVAAAAPSATEPPPFSVHGERYDADDAARSAGLVAQSMAAAGAKSDAMLYDRSFDGSTLNSLGQVKLDLILKGTAAGQPVVIYLNVPHDSLADRQASVATYLKNAGVPDQLQKLVEGPNTNNTSVTASTLSTIYKGEVGAQNGEAADAVVPAAETTAAK